MNKYLIFLSALPLIASPSLAADVKPFWDNDEYVKQNRNRILDYHHSLESIDKALCKRNKALGDFSPLNDPQFAKNAIKTSENISKSKGKKFFSDEANRGPVNAWALSVNAKNYLREYQSKFNFAFDRKRDCQRVFPHSFNYYGDAAVKYMYAKHVAGPPEIVNEEVDCMKAADFEGCMKYKSKKTEPMSIEWPQNDQVNFNNKGGGWCGARRYLMVCFATNGTQFIWDLSNAQIVNSEKGEKGRYLKWWTATKRWVGAKAPVKLPDIEIGSYSANTTIYQTSPYSAYGSTTIQTPKKIPGAVIPGRTAGWKTEVTFMTLDCKDQTVDIKSDGKAWFSMAELGGDRRDAYALCNRAFNITNTD